MRVKLGIPQITVRQSYTRTLKELAREQRFRNHPKNRKRAVKADHKVKTIAGRLVRELERNLPEDSAHQESLALFKQVLSQTKKSKNKIYSLHEPDVQCISKGKEHKKYEFGNKVSIISSIRGVILGACSFRNEYDGHTIDQSLEQVKRMTGRVPRPSGCRPWLSRSKRVWTDSYRHTWRTLKRDNRYVRAKKRKLFCKRAGIEPRIGHLKSDHRLGRNFYKGLLGDAMNVMLAAAAFNFKRAMRALWLFIEKRFWNEIKLVVEEIYNLQRLIFGF